jgi:shikimate dehydrogenase
VQEIEVRRIGAEVAGEPGDRPADAREPAAVTRLGVLGWPVAHSRSPAMQNAALRALGLDDWTYQRLPVPPELFEETARALGGAGFRGANVTIPYKQAALALASEASAAAKAIGAANTLTFTREGASAGNATESVGASAGNATASGGASAANSAANAENDAEGGGVRWTIAAENTDAPGLIAAMERAGQSPSGRSALVLGAGGTARAAVWALREAGASEVSVWNRTFSRAHELADSLGARVVPLPEKADILINCTSIGMTRMIEGRSSPASGRPRHARPRHALVPPASVTESDLNLLSLTHDLVGRYSYVVDFVYAGGAASQRPAGRNGDSRRRRVSPGFGRAHPLSVPPTELLAAARERGVPTLDGLELLVAQGALSLELWTGRTAPLEVMRRASREAPIAA